MRLLPHWRDRYELGAWGGAGVSLLLAGFFAPEFAGVRDPDWGEKRTPLRWRDTPAPPYKGPRRYRCLTW